MKTVFTTSPRRASSPLTVPSNPKPSTIPVNPIGTASLRLGASSPLPITVPKPLCEGILPPYLLRAIEQAVGETGHPIEEIRLRAGRCASLTLNGENHALPLVLTQSELTAILTRMCGGSLYAYSQTIHEGYISLPDGIRVGIAGRAVCEEGRIIGVCEITGLCIRLPHIHRDVGREICRLFRDMNKGETSPKGILLYAPPGEGKTTLLRAVAAGLAGCDHEKPLRTVVVDTRGELGFETEGRGLCLDILKGYPRPRGVEIATRTLSAQVIICDEIGDAEEAMSLISTHHGGVPLIASAHGGSITEILRRTGIRLLHEAKLFGVYAGIRRDGRGGFTYHVTPHASAEAILTGQYAEGMTACGGER